jgi:hypothetical protein
MLATVIVEVQSKEERIRAERVLKSSGYAVGLAARGLHKLRVQVRPGEKPEAALHAAGLEFRCSVQPATTSPDASSSRPVTTVQ